MNIAVIGGVPQSLTNFRGDLIYSLQNLGHNVYALAGGEDPQFTDELENNGVKFVSYPIKRTRLNPFADLHTLIFLRRWFIKNNIDFVFSYTAKPIIWGGIAARFAGVKYFHAMVTGLGRQFDSENFKQKLVSFVVKNLYRISLTHASTVTFQNVDDLDFFVDNHLTSNSKTHRVNGSGVDLRKYSSTNTPTDPFVFLTVGRLLASKGFREFVGAADIVSKKYPNAHFRIVGMQEQGSDAIPQDEIESWNKRPYINYVGQTKDTISELASCSVFVLATYLREGVPRTILEAMASGRAVITTNTVGCRDAVAHSVNGLLFEPKDTTALADAMIFLIEHPDTLQSMASNASRLAEEKYDVNKVNSHMLSIMGLQPSRD
ncbi:hypothetical protein AB833_25930 [Chromatiales bacterium (ex Bugula neritina AB1)]|nr:hypothetical protein AB833_25930 [Chromatiales bacterium (ex Bugula neritina AB1)]